MGAARRLEVRFPRMTTRRWMIVVAGVALLAGAWVEYIRLSQLSRQYRRRARVFRDYSIHYRRDVSNYCQWCVAGFRALKSRDSAAMPEERFRNIKREFDVIQSSNEMVADYYLGLARKYERAAANPLRYVPPDPAPPVGFGTLDAWLRKSLYAHYGWFFPPPLPLGDS